MESEVSKVQAAKSRRERPTGITLIAIWMMFAGVIIPLNIKELFASSGSFSSEMHGGFYILIAVASLVFGWGLWTLKSWAVRATTALEIIIIVSAVVWFFILPKSNSTLSVLSLAFAILFNSTILYYLVASQKVREAFRRA